MHISWARLASFCHLGVISDPLIVSKFHNETHDPKGQENKIYTIVKGRETFYRHHTVPVTADTVKPCKMLSERRTLCNSCCLPVPPDNPQALVSGFILPAGGQTWYNYFIPPTSV